MAGAAPSNAEGFLTVAVHTAAFIFTRDPVSVPRARRRVRTRVVSWGIRLDQDSQLALDTITAELVTNAVRHSQHPLLTVGLYADPARGRALVEVYDGSSTMPRARTAAPDEEAGRGMLLIGKPATSHGAEWTARGKRVWAELAIPTQSVTRRQILSTSRRAVRAALRALPRPGKPPDTRVCTREFLASHHRLGRPPSRPKGDAPMTSVTTTDGVLGHRGLKTGVTWSTPGAAHARAAQITAAHRARREEITRNPHLDEEWARAAVRAPTLLAAVQALIGPDVAVQNTFLVVKWPHRTFEIPWHQDGIDARVELDPDRAVSAWLAVSDATVDNGCLHAVPGSQRFGYLPYSSEAEAGAERGRADEATGFTADTTTALPLPAGSALLMDSRLLHRSGTNTTCGARVGLNIRYVAPGAIRRRDPQSPSPAPVSGTGW
ncbi:phytanoyl-CoA dioxygenase family protein [Kitasatospora sp. NPDC091207]|uniref:phytanoyl-CoA dioxygenase family protein n=1 Tax=Kitasatospora sp. NPDC091207 TaxID=3364083 RepID=UPI003806E84F